MVNFKFFNLGGKHYFTISHSYFVAAFYENDKKIGKKFCNPFFQLFSYSFEPTVHNGRVSRGRVCGCRLSDRWQVAGGRWQVACDK